ncbi:unnamed protein product [Rotaria socialis]|uniref:Uncharacterized protein n=1 Tax=Rotaria socialis TaxID=392032 RepID=A0A820T1N7_9BILA|nr:unnamed protein product [Rotaria socialis]CAF3407996.1 unnamed protein product [Rotaria socialis]CAF3640911.1 unnamed protein product [Rotaria socialis]CAF3660336.1 unnamed protein product [Rotaria socialis]CAF3710428.1 unnamed protein product [Rotaria socialis]
MLSSTMSFLIFASLVMISYGRTVRSSDPIIPFIFSPVNTDDNSVMGSTNGHNRFIHVIEQIIRYVSSIKSSETFIQNIVNRHKEPAERMEVLSFLNKCFELTHKVIQREIDYMLGMPGTQKKSSYPPPIFTLEELKQAQKKVDELLTSIQKQIQSLKTWIPPTMPFLGFF